MGGKHATTTSTVSVPPEVLARYNAVNTRAETAASQPFKAFGNTASDYVAQMNAQQNAGISDINATAGSYQPYMNQATTATQVGMGPAYEGIDKYMSPYTKNVADTTGAMMRQQQEQAQSGALGTAAMSGAFGGDRAGIAAANLQQQNQMGYGKTMADIMNQGYTQALGASQADLARQLQGGAQMASLGAQSQQLGLQGAQAKIAAGTLQQQTEQAGKDAMINRFMQEQGLPYQQAQFLANIAMGTGALSGSTTSTATPRNWMGFQDGGRVDGYAGGGGVAGPMEFSKSGIGGMGYVPEANLPVGPLMVADVPQEQSNDGTKQAMQMLQMAMGAARGGVIDGHHGYASGGVAGDRHGYQTDGAVQGLFASNQDVDRMKRNAAGFWNNFTNENLASLHLPRRVGAVAGSMLGDVVNLGSKAAAPVVALAGFPETANSLNKFGDSAYKFADRADIDAFGTNKELQDYDMAQAQQEQAQRQQDLNREQIQQKRDLGNKPIQQVATPSSIPLKPLVDLGLAPKAPPVNAVPQEGLAAASLPPQDLSFGTTGTNIAAPAATGVAAPEKAAPPVIVGTTMTPVSKDNPFDIDRLGAAIKWQESGSPSGNYGAIGQPVSRGDGSTDYAYGAYQIMGANIPQWTQEVLGKPMTPQEFLRDPQAQETVAKAKLSEYYAKYGNAADVASAWFSGRPMNNSVDQTNGKSVPSYVSDVMDKYYGGGQGTPANYDLGTAPNGGVRGGLAAGEKPYEQRNAIGKFFHNPQGGMNQNATLAFLAGLGHAAEAPTISPIGAILSGVGYGADKYRELEKSSADITRQNIANVSDLWTNYQNYVQSPNAQNVPFSQYAKMSGYNGPIPAGMEGAGSNTSTAPGGEYNVRAFTDTSQLSTLSDGTKVIHANDPGWLVNFIAENQSYTQPNVKQAVEAAKARLTDIYNSGYTTTADGERVMLPDAESLAAQQGIAASKVNTLTEMATNASAIGSTYPMQQQALDSITSRLRDVKVGPNGNIASFIQNIAQEAGLPAGSNADATGYVNSQLQNLLTGSTGGGLSAVDSQTVSTILGGQTVNIGTNIQSVVSQLGAVQGIVEYNKDFAEYFNSLPSDQKTDPYEIRKSFERDHNLKQYVETATKDIASKAGIAEGNVTQPGGGSFTIGETKTFTGTDGNSYTGKWDGNGWVKQ